MAVALQVSNISSLVSPPSITSPPFILLPSSKLNSNSNKAYGSIHTTNFKSFRVLYRYSAKEEDDNDGENCSFDEAVALFNERAYYKCHDCLESLWYTAEEPTRTLIHGVLQCAVGFYHLFNQNHKGAMMELGEGLGKLRKMNLRSGPFHEFENEISAALEFIYRTQIELAACADDICLAMDQSERSYQLLGDYAAGQQLYHLESDHNQIMYIVFDPQRSYGSDDKSIKVKLPTLNATEEHLMACK
ncbi:hypothetical protein KPL70_018171 [Citrus sinensis]|uniref:DUF309 domain-containing protein n=2 Tax=Citrus TaxID=2706 RepID=V4SVB1_CITCL|nr:uncharacterized protein LOC18038686 [Citrus x clementina]ESR42955.1 hypothetical protein CICLE_v10012580mg [Citrus x clementina]KAH9673638.1 hypothetical protein KPL70_018171 [Citrus sinensis]